MSGQTERIWLSIEQRPLLYLAGVTAGVWALVGLAVWSVLR